MEDEDAVYTHNRIVFSLKEEWSTGTRRNVDKSWVVLLVKNMPANTGDAGDRGLIPELEDPLE